MASPDQIAAVVANLPDWRADPAICNWDDNTVATMIDLSASVPGQDPIFFTVRQFWVQRVANCSPATDMSDSGASRPLSQTYQHAFEQVKYYDDWISTGNFTSFGKIKRRYKRPHGVTMVPDDYGYGGVYVRTD